jgi:hypothetical protein
MASEQIPFDVDRIPGLAALAEQVQRDRKPRALKRDGETLAYLRPAMQEPELPARAGRRTGNRRSTLLGLAAIGDSITDRPQGPVDVARNKHKYLAEAYGTDSRHQTKR